MHATLLLSKVIDANDPAALKRFGIEAADMATGAERQAYKFIADYAEQNRGQAPSYASVVNAVPAFDYIPDVTDSYEHLVGKVKDTAAKRAVADLFGEKMERDFAANSGKDFIEGLQGALESIRMRTDVRTSVGTDIKREAISFLDEYRRRKDGESFRIWKSKFSTITEQIGGYLSGNMYTWYGRSGRGKSVFTMEEALEAAAQGANVLIWAMEMSRFEWMARAYSAISARAGVAVDTINGVDYEVGFENRALLMGGLTDEFEAGLEVFLLRLAEGDYLPGNITLRAADDADFTRRDIKQLEADIIATKADVVVVDPIYLMDYEANTSRVAGGDVAKTSMRIRRLAGTLGAVIHVVTQAEEVRDDTDEEGNRELRAPKRAEIKKTKAVLEDAANTFGIDTLDGAGLIEIGKGRNGGEGTQVEILYLPNVGVVREMASGLASVEQFGF